MANIVDAFNDSLTEDMAYLKIAVYAVPVYMIANMFVIGKTATIPFFAILVGLLFLALLTQGINNVRLNRKEILTFNFVKLGMTLLKTAVVLIPQILVFGAIGHQLTTKVSIPIDLPQVPLIYSIIVWSIIFSIILTSYLSFAKYLRIKQGYNFKIIVESCIDVLISFLFFIPQIILANIILIGPVAYVFSVFNPDFANHWGFVAYCSMVFVVNISILANYLALTSFEQIKGNNEEYDENVQINVIDDAATRMNGR
ncbi:MAG: hypothetical protein NC191_02860 [Muribaculaceae bacterium]|nr:hypothetical protein [Muribaculaceae bacterium]